VPRPRHRPPVQAAALRTHTLRFAKITVKGSKR